MFYRLPFHYGFYCSMTFSIESKSKVLPTPAFHDCPMAVPEDGRFTHSDPLINRTRTAMLEAATYKQINISLDSSPLFVAVTWVTFLLHIWHVQDSNLCPQSGIF
jgi:hypothetical protein